MAANDIGQPASIGRAPKVTETGQRPMIVQ
jgi:hypothetical protein